MHRQWVTRDASPRSEPLDNGRRDAASTKSSLSGPIFPSGTRYIAQPLRVKGRCRLSGKMGQMRYFWWRVDDETRQSPRRYGRYVTHYFVARLQALVADPRVTGRCYGRDLMAALPARAALFCTALSLTCWIVAMGVLAVRPGSAITACARLRHRSQMYTCGTPIITLICFRLFPQNEHDRRSPESGTRPLYPGSSTRQREVIHRNRNIYGQKTTANDGSLTELRRALMGPGLWPGPRRQPRWGGRGAPGSTARRRRVRAEYGQNAVAPGGGVSRPRPR